MQSPKAPHTGQHHVTGISNDTSLARDHRLMPHRLKGLGDTPQITHAVIDDGNHILRSETARGDLVDDRQDGRHCLLSRHRFHLEASLRGEDCP
jgi:hypothetical protein